MIDIDWMVIRDFGLPSGRAYRPWCRFHLTESPTDLWTLFETDLGPSSAAQCLSHSLIGWEVLGSYLGTGFKSQQVFKGTGHNGKEMKGNVLFNDALIILWRQTYGKGSFS